MNVYRRALGFALELLQQLELELLPELGITESRNPQLSQKLYLYIAGATAVLAKKLG